MHIKDLVEQVQTEIRIWLQPRHQRSPSPGMFKQSCSSFQSNNTVQCLLWCYPPVPAKNAEMLFTPLSATHHILQ